MTLIYLAYLAAVPFFLWTIWGAGIALYALTAPLLIRDTACTNGIWISIPAEVRSRLTPRQIEAVRAHERGHIAHLHVLSNVLHAMVFIGRSPEHAQAQEFEADDYAAARGYAGDLACALYALSDHPMDMQRARRLGY